MFANLHLPETQTALALSVFFLTFAYEDGATLLAGTLAAAGRLDPRLGFASAFLGIWTGDLGLYILGSNLGGTLAGSQWSRRVLSSNALAKAQKWFARRGTLAIIMSRFVPGSRLPLYVAAGVLKLPVRLFGALTGLCSALWVVTIFASLRFLPATHLGRAKTLGLVTACLLLCPWLAGKVADGIAPRIRLLWRKYSRWEFWPAWLFYPPVAAMCSWLAFKYRGLSLPTIANPAFRNGGLVGESKIEILQAIMNAAPELVADGYALPTGPLAPRLQLAEKICDEHAVSYPFVVKPNIGQRGAGFKLVHSRSDLEQYLARVSSDLVLQRYVADEKEIGVFYYRFPGSARGEIFAVTEKVFPEIVGDGVRPFEALIAADERASLMASTYLKRFPLMRRKVLVEGERVRLVEAGNHCQGCIFREGQHLFSEALRHRIDQVSRQLPGFFIGRYDIRYSNTEDLLRGENFKIIELNGAASEATNIYDERTSLLSAYGTLYRQWELVYAIGRCNRDIGYTPASPWEVVKDLTLYRRMVATYPSAD